MSETSLAIICTAVLLFCVIVVVTSSILIKFELKKIREEDRGLEARWDYVSEVAVSQFLPAPLVAPTESFLVGEIDRDEYEKALELEGLLQAIDRQDLKKLRKSRESL